MTKPDAPMPEGPDMTPCKRAPINLSAEHRAAIDRFNANIGQALVDNLRRVTAEVPDSPERAKP